MRDRTTALEGLRTRRKGEEDVEKYKAKLQDFEAWDVEDVDSSVGLLHGTQPSTFEFAAWLNLDEASSVGNAANLGPV
jgi:hypothetical protein